MNDARSFLDIIGIGFKEQNNKINENADANRPPVKEYKTPHERPRRLNGIRGTFFYTNDGQFWFLPTDIKLLALSLGGEQDVDCVFCCLE